jgi:hypothetical protein
MEKFNVYTYSHHEVEEGVRYCHWSKGITMVIQKDGVEMVLNEDEVRQLVKVLPRTVGGSY